MVLSVLLYCRILLRIHLYLKLLYGTIVITLGMPDHDVAPFIYLLSVTGYGVL